jgi:hypothetical protein
MVVVLGRRSEEEFGTRGYYFHGLLTPNMPLTDVFLPFLGQTPLVVYYSKVVVELGRLVAKGQNMSPP